jgi:hypothetical protein
MTSDQRKHYPGEPVPPDLAMIGRIETEAERNGEVEDARYYHCYYRQIVVCSGPTRVSSRVPEKHRSHFAGRSAKAFDPEFDLAYQVIWCVELHRNNSLGWRENRGWSLPPGLNADNLDLSDRLSNLAPEQGRDETPTHD